MEYDFNNFHHRESAVRRSNENPYDGKRHLPKHVTIRKNQTEHLNWAKDDDDLFGGGGIKRIDNVHSRLRRGKDGKDPMPPMPPFRFLVSLSEFIDSSNKKAENCKHTQKGTTKIRNAGEHAGGATAISLEECEAALQAAGIQTKGIASDALRALYNRIVVSQNELDREYAAVESLCALQSAHVDVDRAMRRVTIRSEGGLTSIVKIPLAYPTSALELDVANTTCQNFISHFLSGLQSGRLVVACHFLSNLPVLPSNDRDETLRICDEVLRSLTLPCEAPGPVDKELDVSLAAQPASVPECAPEAQSAQIDDENGLAVPACEKPETDNSGTNSFTKDPSHGEGAGASDGEKSKSPVVTLELPQNLLANFPTELAVRNLQWLRTIDLSRNMLTVLPREVDQLVQVEFMDFSSNNLQSIECTFSTLTALHTLDLSCNQLNHVPPTLGNVDSLTKLDLSGNPLIQVAAKVYHSGIVEFKEALRTSAGVFRPPRAELRREFWDDLQSMLRESEESKDVKLKFANPYTHCSWTVAVHSVVLEARAAVLWNAAQNAPVDPSNNKRAVSVTGLDDWARINHEAVDGFITFLYVGDADMSPISSLSDDNAIQGAREIVSACCNRDVLDHYDSCCHKHHDIPCRDLFTAYSDLGCKAAVAVTSSGENTTRADMVQINVGSDRFFVHLPLMVHRCPRVNSMLSSNSVTGASAEISFPNLTPGAFHAFLSFLYGGQWECSLMWEDGLSLLHLAWELGCERLRLLTECIVGYDISPDTCVPTWRAAHTMNCDQLCEACVCFAGHCIGEDEQTLLGDSAEGEELIRQASSRVFQH